MKDLKEIQFDRENIILNGHHVQGAILPKNVNELDRDIKIQADTEIPWTLDGEFGGEHKTVMVHVLSKAVDICAGEDNVLFEPPQPEQEEERIF